MEFSTPDIAESDIDAVAEVLRSGWLTTGSVTRELEAALAAYTGSRHVVALSSCTAALEVALAYLGVAGKRVFVPTWTFAATANVPLRLGADVTLVDVEADSLNMDLALVTAALEAEPGDAVVLPVHFAGVPVSEVLDALQTRFDVSVVEDCAHALGSFWADGTHVGNGSRSLAGAFSFYATKNLTCGEGGCLATESDDLADFALRYRLHGLSTDAWRRYGPDGSAGYELELAGMKGNLPDVLSALALSQLSRFPQMQARRRSAAERYLSRFESMSGARPLGSMHAPGSANHLFVAVLDPGVDRSQVLADMRRHGVHCSVHFRPLHTFPLHRSTPMLSNGTADALMHRTISLPLRSNMTDGDVDRTVSALQESLNRSVR